MNWYENRIEWKNNLRAELHYNFVLKKRTFQKFAIYYVEEKIRKVKDKIADIMYDKNLKKHILESTFKCWQQYVPNRKNKKMKKTIADQHFRNHLQSRILGCRFLRWKIFTRNRKALMLKMKMARHHYETKIMFKVFNAFLSHIVYRRKRKKDMERAYHFYSRTLKHKTFKKLDSHRIHNYRKRGKIKLADHYYEKLLHKIIQSFWYYLKRRVYEKECIATFAERRIERMKKKVFVYWVTYIENKKLQHQKFLMAAQLYDNRCKKKCFRKMRIYRLNRKAKKKYQEMKQLQIQSIFDRRILITCLKTWKIFSYNRKIKEEKMSLAHAIYENALKIRHFQLWLQYKSYKITRRRRVIEIQLFHYHKTLKRCFDEWRQFSVENHSFAAKKSDAEKYYKECLIKQTFEMIIKSAHKEKENRLESYLLNEKRRVSLAQKFFGLWRNKMRKLGGNKIILNKRIESKKLNIHINKEELYTREQGENYLSFDFNIESIPESFVWDPMCFAKPRVPEYMMKYEEIH